jgi:hypothetical protein
MGRQAEQLLEVDREAREREVSRVGGVFRSQGGGGGATVNELSVEGWGEKDQARWSE